MNLRDLHYIITIADQGSMAAAARFCNVSAPTLSIQIKKLEDTLGVTLFERKKRKLLFTEAGLQILARARAVLDHVEQMKVIADAAHDPLTGHLRLGAFPTLAPYWFPKIVPQIKAALPALSLELVEEKTEVLLEKLRGGKLDAAVLALPIDADDLVCRSLFWEPFYLATPKNHYLAKLRKVSLSAISNETLLLLEEGHCLRGQALELCQRVGVASGNYRATSLETLRNMVAAGAGVTLMPASAIKAQDNNLAYIPFESPAPGRTLGLCYRATSARKALFKELEGLLKG